MLCSSMNISQVVHFENWILVFHRTCSSSGSSDPGEGSAVRVKGVLGFLQPNIRIVHQIFAVCLARHILAFMVSV